MTPEILEKYEGCNAGVEYVRQRYPDGVEAIKLIEDPDIELEFLHFGKKYLSVSEEELEAYRKRCEIDKYSKFYWFSDHVINSYNVADSSFIENSRNIYKSKSINDSVNIFLSEYINNGIDIRSSTKVTNSRRIIQSRNVANTNNLINCEDIEYSYDLLFVNRARESSFLFKSEDIENCHFGGFLKNCKRCLFCNGLEGKENFIWNEEVSAEDFNRCIDELNFRLNTENKDIIKVYPHKLSVEEHFTFSYRFDSIFQKLSSNFYGWVGTLPHYDDTKFLTLFFKENKEKKN